VLPTPWCVQDRKGEKEKEAARTFFLCYSAVIGRREKGEKMGGVTFPHTTGGRGGGKERGGKGKGGKSTSTMLYLSNAKRGRKREEKREPTNFPCEREKERKR